jgi:hypothetical protein
MVSLVRGFDNGLKDQRLMNSFHIDEGRGTRARIHRYPRAILEGDIVVAALRRIVESTDTFREAEAVGSGQGAPPSHFYLVRTQSTTHIPRVVPPAISPAAQEHRATNVDAVGLVPRRVE